MSPIIFMKQTYRSLRKNWTILSLLFLFLIIGVSMLVGLMSYIFTIYDLVVMTPFNKGMADAEIKLNNLAFSEDSNDVNRNLVFTPEVKKEFIDHVKNKYNIFDAKNEEQRLIFKEDKPGTDTTTQDKINTFYTYLFNNNGMGQAMLNPYNVSDLYEIDNKPVTDEESYSAAKHNYSVIVEWINAFKNSNGNLIIDFLQSKIRSIDPNWQIKTLPKFMIKSDSSNLNKAKYLSVRLFNDDPDITNPSDFFANVEQLSFEDKIDTTQYNRDQLIYFYAKDFRNFDIKLGQTMQIKNYISDNYYSEGSKDNPKQFVIAGTFLDQWSLNAHDRDAIMAMSFSTYWQEQRFIADFNQVYTIQTNQTDLTTTKLYYQKMNQMLTDQNKGLVYVRPNAVNKEPNFLDAEPKIAYNYRLFWKINMTICTLVMVMVAILIISVIVFITKQLIENNRTTLYFLKNIGMNNKELSLMNIGSILLPIILSFLFAIPGIFLIQNVFSFLLTTQYPFELSFWYLSPYAIIAFAGIFVFTMLIFFIINLLFLINPHLLNAHGSNKKVKINNSKFKNFVFNRVRQNTRIALAINGTNIRKSFTTFILLGSTFSVVLFGIDFKESILIQSKNVTNMALPYKNYSGTNWDMLYGNNQLAITGNVDKTDKEISEDEMESLWNAFSDMGLLGIVANNPNPRHRFVKKSVLQDLTGIGTAKYLYSVVLVTQKMEKQGYSKETIHKVYTFLINLNNSFKEIVKQQKASYGYDGEFTISFGAMYAQDPVIEDDIDIKSNQYLNLNSRVVPNEYVDFGTDVNMQGFFDNSMDDIFVTPKSKRASSYIPVTISQLLASKLKITSMQANNGSQILDIEIPLFSDKHDLVRMKLNVIGIVKKDIVKSNIYFHTDDLFANLANRVDPNLKKIGRKYQKTRDKLTYANTKYTSHFIPSSLLNLTIPITQGDGTKLVDYTGATGFNATNLTIMDFKMAGDIIVKQTNQYSQIIQRIMMIFSIIAIIVSLLLTYLFLIENRKNILLFKSLGYSTLHINRFILAGYFIATFLAVGIGVLASFLAMTFISSIFLQDLGFLIPYVFSGLYGSMLIALPLAFGSLIIISSFIYIHIADPKQALEAE